MMLNYRYFIILTIILLVSCEGEHEIGKLAVKGTEGIYIKLYQEDEFDDATAIDFEIIDANDETITGRCFLTGTHDYEDDLSAFTAGCYDNIIYLTYIDNHNIYAVYDLKSRWGYPQGTSGEDYKDKFRKADELIFILQQHDPELKASYH